MRYTDNDLLEFSLLLYSYNKKLVKELAKRTINIVKINFLNNEIYKINKIIVNT